MEIKQRSTAEQSAISTINGRLIHKGGGFTFNDKLFDEYLSDVGCSKFRDIRGNIFDSITIYHVVPVAVSSVSSYVSTDKGLFMYTADTGEVTVLSYDLNDMIFMRLFYDESNQNNNVLIGCYPLDEEAGYGVRKITFKTNGTLTYEALSTTLPAGVKWMKHKNIINNPWKKLIADGDYPICYSGKDIWFLVCAKHTTIAVTINGIRKVTITDIDEVTDAINQNTILINTDSKILYLDIKYLMVHAVSGNSVSYNNIGTPSSHTKSLNISWYDQYYMNRNNTSSTFMLVIDNAKDSHPLSFAYIVFNNSLVMEADGNIYHIETDESNDGINGGYVYGDINHRMYTTIDPSGYTDGESVYATRRHIFASSTKLMDIIDNPLAVLKYFRANDKTHYSILPATNKTPIFTINASIEIDTEKYGNVIATDYNSVLGLYYIYTDSHIGTYLISARRLTWAASSIMTQIKDIWSFSDITVIDGQAKEFVNGIMTTTAMNGPTFDRLFAEIDDLRKRIAALESK